MESKRDEAGSWFLARATERCRFNEMTCGNGVGSRHWLHVEIGVNYAKQCSSFRECACRAHMKFNLP
jgi:hypothetical protein